MPAFPSCQDLLSYSQGSFLANPYTSSKAYVADICQHSADYKELLQ